MLFSSCAHADQNAFCAAINLAHHGYLAALLLEIFLVDTDRVRPDVPRSVWQPHSLEHFVKAWYDFQNPTVTSNFAISLAGAPDIRDCLIAHIVNERSVETATERVVGDTGCKDKIPECIHRKHVILVRIHSMRATPNKLVCSGHMNG